ncbi:MAG TPA: hypothetical protein VK092_03935 [Deinococcales bacterium]|nr:hypothetical protein [Deinococcales bacterium]
MRTGSSMATDGVPALPELLGHEEARAELRSLQTTRPLLFTGPEGVGRRPLARWYAAWLNCSADGPEPCGQCRSCLMFHSGHPDLLEVAPAAVTGSGRLNRRPEIRIGQLVRREGADAEPLGEWLERRPLFTWRVGVIDSADRLTPAAANSFLKTLEEPPSWARLILIAPSVQSLLPTIASRLVPVRLGTVEPPAGPVPGHPARRLGTPGPLLEAAREPARWEETAAAVSAFLESMTSELRESFAAAALLEKTWLGPDGAAAVQLLRSELLERLPAGTSAVALDAVERCEEQLAAYVNATVALQLLALELRRLY